MLFRKKIERSCAYCANGARLGGGQISVRQKGTENGGRPVPQIQI